MALHVNSTLKPGPQFATWRVQIILVARNTYVSLKHITRCPAKTHPGHVDGRVIRERIFRIGYTDTTDTRLFGGLLNIDKTSLMSYRVSTVRIIVSANTLFLSRLEFYYALSDQTTRAGVFNDDYNYLWKINEEN